MRDKSKTHRAVLPTTRCSAAQATKPRLRTTPMIRRQMTKSCKSQDHAIATMASVRRGAQRGESPNLKEIAQSYVEAGISVIPIATGGSKAPAASLLEDQSWSVYRTRFPTEHELNNWFGGRQPIGIAFICGVQSAGLEVLDFDLDADEIFNAWWELVPSETRCRLCVVETGGLGYHVLYRCRIVCKNKKIAMLSKPNSEGGQNSHRKPG